MPSYTWKPITIQEGTILRALAILAIVFHNYLHWVSDSPGENEFTFRPERGEAFILGLQQTPWDAIRLLATYLGHYGVQVFFFLSGYGLAAKYAGHLTNASPLPSWWSFQKKRWSSLFPAILMAALGYLIFESIRLDCHHVLATEGINLIRQISGISNFLPDNVYHPIGPWWFISVILQFYLIAPFILKSTQRYGNTLLYALIGGTFLMERFLGPILDQSFALNINHTILGHLDTCALGIWLARKKSFSLPLTTIVLAGTLFILGNLNATLWITTGITVLIFALPAMRLISSKILKNKLTSRVSLYLGNLSLYLFLCNGYLRHPIIDYAQQQSHWWTSIWTSLMFLILTILWATGLRKLELSIRSIKITADVCKR